MTNVLKNKKSLKRERRHKKIRYSIKGTAECPRLCVAKTNTAVYLQLVDDDASKTLAASSTRDKAVKGKTLVEKSVSAGKTLAEKASALNIKKVVFDRGGNLYTGKVKAAAEGAREGGLMF
jgi:large subunit ribosomal protein L18